MKRKVGKTSLGMLRAIIKNPSIDRNALRHVYGYGDYIKALKKLGVVQFEGKWILDAELIEYVQSKEEPPKPANIVPARQVNVFASKPYVMPPIRSTREGALDYQNIASLYAA